MLSSKDDYKSRWEQGHESSVHCTAFRMEEVKNSKHMEKFKEHCSTEPLAATILDGYDTFVVALHTARAPRLESENERGPPEAAYERAPATVLAWWGPRNRAGAKRGEADKIHIKPGVGNCDEEKPSVAIVPKIRAQSPSSSQYELPK